MLLGPGLKFRLKVDDSLDVLAVHYVGGVVGMLFIGLLGRALLAKDGAVVGLLNGGGAGQLGKQAVAVLAASAFAFAVSYVLARIVRATMGLRVSDKHEYDGLDYTQHGESAYEIVN